MMTLNLSDKTVEFLTECTYGDTYREITRLPERYRWLKSLMRTEGNGIAQELTIRGLALTTRDNRVLIDMSKLPELAKVIDRLERGY